MSTPCFLALNGNSWGRASTQEEAVAIAYRELKAFAKAFGGLAGRGPFEFGIYDHEPYDSMVWGGNGVFGTTPDGKDHRVSMLRAAITDEKGEITRWRELEVAE